MKRILALTAVLVLAIGCYEGGADCFRSPIKSAKAAESNITATILSGQTKSQSVDLIDLCVVGIQFPAAMTGSNITAECGVDVERVGGSFVPLFEGDGTTAWTLPVNTDRFVDLTLQGKAICGCRFLKIVSDAPEGGDRAIKLQEAN